MTKPMHRQQFAGVLLLTVSLLLAVGSAGDALAEKPLVRFVSPEAALEQGVGAYRGGFYQQALPALTFAAEKGLVVGQYYLALLYADNASVTTSHAKAHDLFREIVERNARTVDVYDSDLAPYIGRSLTALARYYLHGLPEHGLKADPGRAAEYLQQADTFFGDPDAKFELAKMYLTGDGVPENRRQALTRLSDLKNDGHIAATAFLANLMWQGKVMPRNEVEALRLIRWAVDNAPARERIWIEDIYQSIYCGAGAGVRQQADRPDQQIAGFRRKYTPRQLSEAEERAGVGIAPKRTCDNGETLPMQPMRDTRTEQDSRLRNAAGTMPAVPPPPVVDARGPETRDRR